MKKRMVSLLCVLTLLAAILLVSVAAANTEDGFDLTMDVTATTSDGTTTRELDDLRAGDLVTVKLNVPGGYAFSGAQAKLHFDNTKFEVTDITSGLEPEKTSKVAGWSVEPCEVSDANANGWSAAVGVGYVLESGKTVTSVGNFAMAEDWTILTTVLKVKENVRGNASFTVSASAEETCFYSMVGGKDTAYSVTAPSAQSVTVVQELNSAVALDGQITTPAKNETNASSLTGTNVTASVTWSPALTEDTFAANTEYTATITVTPNAGYFFGSSATVTFGDYVFTPSGNSFVATKTFAKTDDRTLTGLSVTQQPTKTTYVHGDKLDTTGMVLKAIYDDDDTSPETYTGAYTIDYENGGKDYLKYSDSEVEVLVCVGEVKALVNGLTVDKKQLTLTGVKAKDREYNGKIDVELDTTNAKLIGVVQGEEAGVSWTIGNYGNVTVEDIHVGENKPVTFVAIPQNPAGSSVDYSDNYTIASVTDVTVNITKRPITVTSASDSKTYNGEPLANDGWGGDDIACGDNADVSVTGTITEVGETQNTIESVTISRGGVDVTKDYSITLKPGTLTVTKATLVPILNDDWNKTYDGNPVTLEVTNAPSDATVAWSYNVDPNATDGWTETPPTDVGIYYVKVKLTGMKNYEDAEVSGHALSITPAAAPTDITGSIYVYHASTDDITFNVSDLKGTPAGWKDAKFAGAVYALEGDAVLVSANYVEYSTDGKTLTIHPSGTAGTGKTATLTMTVNSKNYETANVPITITTVDVAFEYVVETVKTSPVYGDTWADIVTLNPAATAKINGQIIEGTFTLENATEYPSAGNQTYKIVFASTDGTYSNLVADTGTVNVAQRPITVTAGSKSRAYDGQPLTDYENHTVTTGSLATGDVISKANYGEGSGLTAVGTADNTITSVVICRNGTDVTANYNITYATGTLTVTARPISDQGITVTEIPAETYSGSALTPKPTVKMGSTTLEKGTDYTLSYADNTDAGTATITITGIGNFTGTRTVNFTINKKQPVLNTDFGVTLPVSGSYTGAAYTANFTNASKVGTATITYTPEGGQPTTTAPTAAGTYSVSVSLTEGANYTAVSDVDCGSFTISKTALTATATVADKVYNSKTDDAAVTLTFNGLVNGETLTEGVDYTVSASYTSANAGDAVDVTVAVTLLNTAKVNNYSVTSPVTATGKITRATATLSLAAADATYTGAAYAGTLTPTSNVGTSGITYTWYSDAACEHALSGAPTDAGTYYVKGTLAESGNYGAVTSAAAKFTIAKAPLTFTAKAKTITYGDAPANDGVEFTGFVGSDAGTGVTAEYTYSYAQFGSVGDYTITPKNAAGDVLKNYTVTYANGALTVEQKPLTLTWSAESAYYYNAQPQGVTATLDGVVNNDDVTLTVAGAQQTEVGSYTAKATISGAKTGNYIRPTNLTQPFAITSALTESDLTVSPATVTATIDGLTIKLTGYREADETVTVNGQTESVTANGVTYTIDSSAVTLKRADLTLDDDVHTNDTTNSGITGFVEGAAESTAGAVIGAADQKPEAKKAIITIEITVKQYETSESDKKLKLEIKPVVTWHDDNNDQIGDKEHVSNDDIAAPITITITLPSGFRPQYAKHDLGNGRYEYLKITISGDGKTATWKQSSFSEVELVMDTRSVTANFNLADGSVVTRTLTPADVGSALPTDSKSGYSFSGWTCGSITTKTLTDEFLTALCEKATTESAFALDLTASFTQNSGFGGGAISGGATVTPDEKEEEPTHNACDHLADVTEELWCHDAVEFVYDRGLMKGVTDTMFDASRTLNRGMFVTILYRLAGSPAVTGESPFSDVTDATWCRDAVLWAAENGIVKGYSDDTFRPGDAVTRQQLVTFLYRYAQLVGYDTAADADALVAFADADSASTYARDALAWAYEAGILQGSNGNILPTRDTNRGQTATFLMRFLTQFETEAE